MIATEAKSLADRMPTMLQEKANESLQRVTDKVAADVKKEIPGLTPEHVKRLSDITVEGMAIESEKLQKQPQALTNTEVERISKLLDTLPIDTAVLMDEELLQQRFMHNILLIVDRTVAPTMSVLKTDSPLVRATTCRTVNFQLYIFIYHLILYPGDLAMSNPDAATVENRLQALENRLTKNAATAKSRLTLTVVVMACLLVGVFFYLRFSTTITVA